MAIVSRDDEVVVTAPARRGLIERELVRRVIDDDLDLVGMQTVDDVCPGLERQPVDGSHDRSRTIGLEQHAETGATHDGR